MTNITPDRIEEIQEVAEHPYDGNVFRIIDALQDLLVAYGAAQEEIRKLRKRVHPIFDPNLCTICGQFIPEGELETDNDLNPVCSSCYEEFVYTEDR